MMTPHTLTEDLKAIYGSHLKSVVLFGSAAAGDHAGKHSDYNVLVVLERVGPEELQRLSRLARRWVKAGNPVPLLFTPEGLKRSAATFPLEMADLSEHHEVLCGDDVLRDLHIERANFRLLLEHELRGKLLQLKHRYVLAHGDSRNVTELMLRSLSTFLALFRGVLRLYQSEIPSRKMDAVAALARHIPLDTGVLETLTHLKVGRRKAGVVADALFAAYLRVIESVVEAVDALPRHDRAQEG